MTTLAQERWQAVAREPVPTVSWAAALNTALPRELCAATWLATLVRRRMSVARGSAWAPGPGIAVQDGLLFLKLPPPRPPDDLAEAVAACNDLARARGWPERLALGRLTSETRSRMAFATRVLAPVLGCSARVSARVPAPDPSKTVTEWCLACELARLRLLVLSSAELARPELRRLFALWLRSDPPCPYLLVEYQTPNASVLVTNCSTPPKEAS